MAATTIDLSNLNGINGFRLDGVTTYDHAGYSISNAGDVNGDGFGDVIVSALRADPNGQNSGSSYVVFGKATEFNPSINLSNLDGKNGFRLDGAKAADYSGWSVSAAGDVNNDGFDDLIIGAPWADPSDSFLGSSYVVFGKATGFNAHMNLSSLDGKNGFRLDGATEYDNLGFSVSNAGDVNGDGFDDLIVGAPNANSNYYDSGSSYVVFGKASGFDHPLNLSTVDGANGFRVGGERMNDELGF